MTAFFKGKKNLRSDEDSSEKFVCREGVINGVRDVLRFDTRNIFV